MVIIPFGTIPSWKIIFFPFVLIPLFLLASGMGLALSLVSVVSIDIKKSSKMGMALLMWLAPIIYSDSVSHPVLKLINHYNALTHLVCSARDMVLYGRLYDLNGFMLSSALSLIVFLFAVRLFYIAKSKVVERIL
jgi:ABC-type polysaccharide/polyol phosphate export permease